LATVLVGFQVGLPQKPTMFLLVSAQVSQPS